MKNLRPALLFASLVLYTSSAFAQYRGTEAARAAYDKAKKESSDGDYAAAVADYKKAIDLDSNYAEAHEYYIFERGLAAEKWYIDLETGSKKPTPEDTKKLKAQQAEVKKSLLQEYTSLAKNHPDKPIYLWALGQLYNEDNPTKQEEYCRQSIQVDAKFTPGYECLSQIAHLRGDVQSSIEFQQKVVELEPDSPEAAFNYVMKFRDDPAAYQKATMEFVAKFPNAKESSQALLYYGERLDDDAAKVQVMEQVCSQFPIAKFDETKSATEQLIGVYDRADPAKARALAHHMADLDPKDKQWGKYAEYEDSMAKAEQDIDAKDAAAASAILNAMKAPSWPLDGKRKDLLAARALDVQGKTSDAYANLLAGYVKHPSDEIHAAVVEYGAKIGKSAKDVETQIWSDTQKNSTPAIPFALPNFTDGQKVSLESYKGHVVIVDFWFPNCGPCRASFPYLQQLAAKYKDKGVVVLAINGLEGQEDFVVPIMKNMKYDFLPLRGTEDWASSVYSVRGYPTTFLIGADGRQYYKPHVYDAAEERSAEIEIDTLLAHTAPAIGSAVQN
jgi:thiol-disulfide isomerase/thioredoxin